MRRQLPKSGEVSQRQKTLLIFLNSDREADPIRIMKGLFIFAKESAPKDWLKQDAFYSFIPYYYGPFSSQVYSDLDHLCGLGYVTAKEVVGCSWKYYSLTDEGRRIVRDVAKDLNAEAVAYLQKVRDFVGSLSLRTLITLVYKHYPKYAINSVFKF